MVRVRSRLWRVSPRGARGLRGLFPVVVVRGHGGRRPVLPSSGRGRRGRGRVGRGGGRGGGGVAVEARQVRVVLHGVHDLQKEKKSGLLVTVPGGADKAT